MSPRSQELMESARERLAGARDSLAADHFELAVSAAYYAMLYAARAALSELGDHAKTPWNWTLSATPQPPPSQDHRPRSGAPRHTPSLSAELADELIDAAAAFIVAVETMLAAGKFDA